MEVDEPALLLRQSRASEHRATEECPDDAEIAAFVDGGLAADQARHVRSHVAGCDYCLDRVGFLGRLKETAPVDAPEIPPELLDRVRNAPERARRSTGPRWRVPAAAAAALVLVILSVDRLDDIGESGEAPSEVRNGIAILEPPAIVWPREASVIPSSQLRSRGLSWTPVPGAIFYEVRLVTADGERIWDGRVETEGVIISDRLPLIAGQDLFVWVRAILPGGKTLQSEIVGFRLGDPALE